MNGIAAIFYLLRLHGESDVEDHLIAGSFQADLQPGEKLTFVATTDSHPELDETPLTLRAGPMKRSYLRQPGCRKIHQPKTHRRLYAIWRPIGS